MTREALRAGLISVDFVKQALLDWRGDIFRSAQSLGCTARELDSYIRASDELQVFVSSIEKVKANPEYDKLSNKQFEDELANLTRVYRVEALQAIHELATIDIESETEDGRIVRSAAMAKVKLDAAIALHGGTSVNSGNSDLDPVLHELNRLYQANAPRISEIRQTTITLTQDMNQQTVSSSQSQLLP